MTFPSCAPSERLGSVHSFRVVLSPPRVNSPTRSQVLSFSQLTFSSCAPSERLGSVHSFHVVHSTPRHISSAPTTPRAVSACHFASYLNTFRARVRSFTFALSRGGWPGVCVARRRRPRRGRGFPPAASRRPATSRVQAARRWRASPGRVRSPCLTAHWNWRPRRGFHHECHKNAAVGFAVRRLGMRLNRAVFRKVHGT